MLLPTVYITISIICIRTKFYLGSFAIFTESIYVSHKENKNINHKKSKKKDPSSFIQNHIETMKLLNHTKITKIYT